MLDLKFLSLNIFMYQISFLSACFLISLILILFSFVYFSVRYAIIFSFWQCCRQMISDCDYIPQTPWNLLNPIIRSSFQIHLFPLRLLSTIIGSIVVMLYLSLSKIKTSLIFFMISALIFPFLIGRYWLLKYSEHPYFYWWRIDMGYSHGDNVTLSWSGVSNASNSDWIGAYLVNDDVQSTAPIKYQYASYDPQYLATGTLNYSHMKKKSEKLTINLISNQPTRWLLLLLF